MAARDATDAQGRSYVSRGGVKLAHALAQFNIDVEGKSCADLGCSTGGFTDCLLKHGAAVVYAVDTAYGELAYALRTDERVHVMERTNALKAEPPADGVDLVVIDLGWTPQRRAIPAAVAWLRSGGEIVSLVKPHYEASDSGREALLVDGVLTPEDAELVLRDTLEVIDSLEVEVLGCERSPVVGGGRRKGRERGNIEWMVHCRPRHSQD